MNFTLEVIVLPVATWNDPDGNRGAAGDPSGSAGDSA